MLCAREAGEHADQVSLPTVTTKDVVSYGGCSYPKGPGAQIIGF